MQKDGVSKSEDYIILDTGLAGNHMACHCPNLISSAAFPVTTNIKIFMESHTYISETHGSLV